MLQKTFQNSLSKLLRSFLLHEVSSAGAAKIIAMLQRKFQAEVCSGEDSGGAVYISTTSAGTGYSDDWLVMENSYDVTTCHLK